MTETIENDFRNLLANQMVPVEVIDCQRDDAITFCPRTKVNMGYIVATVLFNSAGQVLMVQEAKKSCCGSWYLPAGRLEPGENFVEGACREVKEEAGLDCIITTLLSLHFGHGQWIRLSFTGTITGGKLKSLEQQDEESLQAKFFDISVVLNKGVNLRCRDIIPLIQEAVDFTANPKHLPMLPVLHLHTHLLHRPTIVVQLISQMGIQVLCSLQGGKAHLPVSAISPKDISLWLTLQLILTKAFGAQTQVSTHLVGLLGVEHCGMAADGVCLNTLVRLNLPENAQLPPVCDKVFQWMPLTDKHLIQALDSSLQGHIVRIKEGF